MSYFSGTIFSETLNMDTSLTVILPQDSRWHRGLIPLSCRSEKRAEPKTLILLHGLTDNWSAWAHRSRIYSYAEAYDIAVIIPEVQRSFYQDLKYGPNYFTFITEELPKLASELFHLSVEPEDLMIAGMSMGGYGALKCGLTYPERYCAIGGFSAAADINAFVVDIPERRETMGLDRDIRAMFGEKLEVPEESQLPKLADRLEGKKNCPPFYITCGKQDSLHEQDTALVKHMIEKGLQVVWEDWDGGHDWDFWDTAIHKFLKMYL